MSKHLLLTVGTGGDKKQRLVNMGLVKIARNSIDGTNLTFNDDSFIAVNESLEQIEAQLLRDEFAARAMAAMIAGGATYQEWEHLSIDAYALADAMLKERLK